MNWSVMAISFAVGAIIVGAWTRDALEAVAAGAFFAAIVGDVWPVRWMKR